MKLHTEELVTAAIDLTKPFFILRLLSLIPKGFFISWSFIDGTFFARIALVIN